MSVRQAAEALGVHYMTAYRYVRLGQLPSTQRGGVWTIKRADLRPFAPRRRPPRSPPRAGGAPTRCASACSAV